MLVIRRKDSIFARKNILNTLYQGCVAYIPQVPIARSPQRGIYGKATYVKRKRKKERKGIPNKFFGTARKSPPPPPLRETDYDLAKKTKSPLPSFVQKQIQSSVVLRSSFFFFCRLKCRKDPFKSLKNDPPSLKISYCFCFLSPYLNPYFCCPKGLKKSWC